jgi:hypothetical protein
VDKVAELCSLDHVFLSEYSRRSIGRIAGRSSVMPPLPFLSKYMEANVEKETEKDRLIIRYAAEALKPGESPEDAELDDLFEETKAVDRRFLKRLLIPSLSIHVSYEEIADIRKKRIELLASAAALVFGGWIPSLTFHNVVRAVFTQSTFTGSLADILHLYNLETRVVTRSVRFFSPLNRAITHFADSFFEAMEAVSQEMLSECSEKIFSGEKECTEQT